MFFYVLSYHYKDYHKLYAFLLLQSDYCNSPEKGKKLFSFIPNTKNLLVITVEEC